MLKRFTKKRGGILVLGFLVLGIVACDTNREAADDGGNENTSAPTDLVAKFVGPVEALVTDSVLDKANSVRDSFNDYLVEATGGTQHFNDLKKAIDDSGGSEQIYDMNLAEAINCDTAGTKSIIGSGTFVLDADSVSGSFSGTFTVQYVGCQDNILMETSNGNCVITPSVTGEVAVTLTTTYTLGSSIGQDTTEIDDATLVEALTNADLDVAVGATAADQGYNFSYTLLSTQSDTNLDGLVSYAGNLYDMVDLEAYIQDSATTTICE